MMSRLIPSHSPRANVNLHPKMLTQLTQASHTFIVTVVFVCKLHPRTEDFYHWSLGCSPFFVFFGCHEFVPRFQQRFVTSEMYKSVLDRADGHVGANMTRLTRHFYKSLERIGALDTCPCNAVRP